MVVGFKYTEELDVNAVQWINYSVTREQAEKMLKDGVIWLDGVAVPDEPQLGQYQTSMMIVTKDLASLDYIVIDLPVPEPGPSIADIDLKLDEVMVDTEYSTMLIEMSMMSL